MDFVPVNDDHAVKSVSFSVLLVDPFQTQTLNALSEMHATIKSELPGFRQVQSIEMKADPHGAPALQRVNGVEFANFRPDGSPAWLLQIVGNLLLVQCNRYTRWDRVWDQASKYFAAGNAAISVREPDKKAMAMSLTVVDGFNAKVKEFNIETLFKKSPFIGLKAFEAKSAFHNHLGWLESDGDDEILHNVNVDARPSADPSSPFQITLSHTLELRLKAHPSLENLDIKATMGRFHDVNKRTVASMLTDEICRRIGLDV